MATPRDVQEIVSRLSSNKAKVREEGFKLLSSWLEGEKSLGFCRLLGQNTSMVRPDEIPHAETWPFLITLMTKCIGSEKVSSKKNHPKLIWAKTLRTAIQRAEDPKFSGKALLLLSVAKLLFNHILEVIKDAPLFQSEYGMILRHLLSVKEYRYHMRMRVYSSLLLVYMKRIEMSLTGKSEMYFNTREEIFRCILTLHILLECPPGDFPDNIREDIVKSFVEIFSQVREEGKISRKLMECMNMYLLKDGPNLGSKAMEIHCCLHDFIFRYWLTTHDRGLKNTFILYAKMQLKLIRRTEGGPLIEQLLDVIGKELDQAVGSVGTSWSEATRDDKIGPPTSSQQGLMEIAASVLYQAFVNPLKASASAKRLKREGAFERLRDGVMKGIWLWCGAFCFLIRNYGIRIEESSITNWLKGISESLERILNDSCNTHSYDGVLWILWGLRELCFVLSHSASKKYFSPTSDEVRDSWKTIWSCLVHRLPMFSNVTHVADAALILLGNIILENLINMPVVPQEVWELQIFKHMPSLCALYFITCYFSRGGVQGNHRDALYLRKNLLRAALQLMNSKESVVLDKHTAMVLPAAIFSLCAGYCPFQPSSICPVHVEEWFKSQIQENDEIEHQFLEYSVEVLAEFECRSDGEAPGQENRHSVRLPEEVKKQLIHDMEQYLISSISFDQEIEKKVVSNVLLSCLFLSNCVYSLSLTRLMNERSLLFSKMLGYISKLLEHIVSTMEEKHNELQLCDSLSFVSVSDFYGSALASLCCFIRCPVIQLLGDGSDLDGEINKRIVQSIENLLLFLAKLFEDFSGSTSVSNMSSGSAALFPSSHSSQHLPSLPAQKTRIIDVELDVDDGSNDLDSLGTSGDSTSSFLQWKMDMVSTISVFFTVLPVTTCEVMVHLLEKESDPKVAEYLLVTLCKCFPPSDGTLASLVTLMNNMMDSSASPKIPNSSILSAISDLLGSLVSSRDSKVNDTLMQRRGQTVSEQNLAPLGVLVNKIAEENLSNWYARVVLIECICRFILLDPSIGQGMISGLFVLLKDPDYRVRLFLARQIGILFQTWDGHNELLHDICSNFGLHLVMATKDKLVKADEVLAAGPQSHLRMETAVITLAHLALYSDRVELEVVFMICAVSAISPDHRDLIYALLDNISRHLLYSSRLKYLEELLGLIISKWITCELSLVALVEVRDLFVAKDEAKLFMQFCCQWLIPLLIIRQDMTNLNLVSMIAGQPLSLLVKKHFVKIFAISMALCCSSRAEEAGEVVLSSSILQIAEISEHERDDLIKKYMVSIVSCLLSLSSASSDPPMPFFSMETVASAIQTVIDGFLEIDNCPSTAGVIDKLNIFRPDRVFKFLVEIHYLITSAVHPRHKCNRLSAVEVLVKIIGYRATVSSTSLYVFNLVGQFIADPALQDQCCAIVSTLLLSFRGQDPIKDGVNILGEQLQLLISKLVVCCSPDDSTTSAGASSLKIVSLLEQLIVDADSSLYDYIRELESLPDIACFQRIQKFHKELCKACSPRDHFLKFAKKISHIPWKVILWSLRALHVNLLLGKIIQPEIDTVDASEGFNCWTKDPDLVSAVWTLVGVCASSEVKEISSLVADFISRVGIGDPHRIVFHLPGNVNQHESYGRYAHDNADEGTIHNGLGVSEEVLVNLLGLLKKYLLDDGAAVVDITARTLRGILSTELGQRALLTFNAYDRSLISVHSKGVNSQLVEKLIFDCDGKSISGDLSEMALWKTHLKSYEMWICPLVHSLIYYSHDNILRFVVESLLGRYS